jgi:hypothetical protein
MQRPERECFDLSGFGKFFPYCGKRRVMSPGRQKGNPDVYTWNSSANDSKFDYTPLAAVIVMLNAADGPRDRFRHGSAFASFSTERARASRFDSDSGIDIGVHNPDVGGP